MFFRACLINIIKQIIYVFRAIWEFAQSATEDPQNITSKGHINWSHSKRFIYILIGCTFCYIVLVFVSFDIVSHSQTHPLATQLVLINVLFLKSFIRTSCSKEKTIIFISPAPLFLNVSILFAFPWKAAHISGVILAPSWILGLCPGTYDIVDVYIIICV